MTTDETTSPAAAGDDRIVRDQALHYALNAREGYEPAEDTIARATAFAAFLKGAGQ